MKTGAIVLGYHGCDRSVAEGLLSGANPFKPSRNAHDWLGHGIYFWENNPSRAMEWATFMASHPAFSDRVKEPSLVGAVIDLGNCLDLTESDSLEETRTAYEYLHRSFQSNDLDLPRNQPSHNTDEDLTRRYLDCAVINHVHFLNNENNLDPYSTVRGVFVEGEPLYPGAAIRQRTHIQICVCDPSNIRGVFRFEGSY